MSAVYLFNPENDMALASGSPYYMAPANVKKMAADLAALPAWYALPGSGVLMSDERQKEWMKKEYGFMLDVEWLLDIPDIADTDEKNHLFHLTPAALVSFPSLWLLNYVEL